VEPAEVVLGLEGFLTGVARSPPGLGYRADVEVLRDPEQRPGIVEPEQLGDGLELVGGEAGPAGELVVGRPI
jgi:hypothetical protein